MSATVSTLLQDINIKDGNFVDRLENRTLYQANDYELKLTFLDGNDRADGTDLPFSFIVQSTSGEVFDIAGAWTTATSGEGTISVPAASLNFTGTSYTGLIRFNGSVVAEFPLVVKAYGTPAPEAGVMIDWSLYTGYSNTAANGPVRPDGSTLEVDSTNADGSINLGVIDGTYLPASTPVRKYKVESASFTALPEYLHIVVATSTATDFTPPVEGSGYSVLVWNGTATVGGVAYATKGTVIERRYHSGSWSQKVYVDQEQVGSAVQTALGLKSGLADANTFTGINTFTGNMFASSLSPRTGDTFSLGLVFTKWLSGWITTINTATLKALSASGLVFQDSTGTTQATVDNTGLDATALSVGGTDVALTDEVVKLTGDQDIAGAKTFGSEIVAPSLRPNGGTTSITLISGGYRVTNIAGSDATGIKRFTNTLTQVDVLDSDGYKPATTNTFALGTTALRWLSGWITTINGGIIKALAGTGLVVQNTAGVEKLKVGASTGADVQVTGDLSVTEKQATVYSLSDSRDAVMVGDETLTLTSATNQYLDPNGADRNLDLPDASIFIVSNTGDGGEVITVRDSSDVTIDEVDNGVTLRFQWTGSAWRVS